MFLFLKELGCDEKITGLHMDSCHKIIERKHVFLTFSHLEANNVVSAQVMNNHTFLN